MKFDTINSMGRIIQDCEMTAMMTAMMTYVVSEGRLFGLTPSEWSMMLVGVAFCGFITLLF
jgi:hypothetical protein